MAAKRVIQYHFFATEEEAAEIEAKQKAPGIRNKCAFLRKMAIDGYCIRMDLSGIEELIRLLRINSNNLNQYAKKANESGSVYLEDIRILQEQQKVLWVELRSVLDRLGEIGSR